MSNAVTIQPPRAGNPSPAVMQPQTMGEAIDLAKLMAQSALVPEHLRGKPADCLLVIEQAARWRASPYAVAQCTSSVHGRLMFEGKLISAVIHSSGHIAQRMRYGFSGAGDGMMCTATATLVGETEPRTVTATLGEAKTFEKDGKTVKAPWQKQPEQQLTYYTVRKWARRHLPEVMLGIYSPEEFSDPPPAPTRADFVEVKAAETIEQRPEHYLDLPADADGNLVAEWAGLMRRKLEAAQSPEEASAIMQDNGPGLEMLRGRGPKAAAVVDRLTALEAEAITRTSQAPIPEAHEAAPEPQGVAPAAEATAELARATDAQPDPLAPVRAALATVSTPGDVDGAEADLAPYLEDLPLATRQEANAMIADKKMMFRRGRR